MRSSQIENPTGTPILRFPLPAIPSSPLEALNRVRAQGKKTKRDRRRLRPVTTNQAGVMQSRARLHRVKYATDEE